MRIYERIEVIGEDGRVIRTFQREMDPRHYWISPDLRDAHWIQRRRKLTEHQAEEFERAADSASEQPSQLKDVQP